MKLGVYMGAAGQLALVYRHFDTYSPWHDVITLSVSDTQSFWLENGSMSSDLTYLLQGWEYLGEL